MRAVVQRVSSARVTVEDELTGEIGHGLVVLVGVADGDTDADARYVAEKVVNLRIFEDDEGKMNHSILNVGGAVLAISQFTLLGDCRKGRRPSFVHAARVDEGNRLYEGFCSFVREFGIPVATGRFQAMMDVASVNHGPVTILIDSEKSF